LTLNRAYLLVVWLLLWGCQSESGSPGQSCTSDEIRSGNECVPGPDTPQPDASAPDPNTMDANVLDAAPATGSEPDGFPVIVDEWFGPSGYMGDGEAGGITAVECDMRDGAARGDCHGFEWTVGALGWAGVFWQYPDMNWGDLPGLAIPDGAQSVRFTAWGSEGGEIVTFGAGMGDVDGFSATVGPVTLTASPVEYVIDLRGLFYEAVIGAFSWTMDTAEGNATIFIDDLHWSDEPDESMPMPMPMPMPMDPALPLSVDDWYTPSGYMGDGAANGIVDASCEMRGPLEMGACHTFTWTPGMLGWAGVFWQYPDGNWGSETGLAMPQGAHSVRFTAWGQVGGEIIEFGTGMADQDGFGVTRTIELTTEPTAYALDLSNIEYGEVVGGFVWTAAGADSPVTFHVDGIHWSEEPAPTDAMEPVIATLPMAVAAHFVPAGYMGDAQGIMPGACPENIDDMDCTAFDWIPSVNGPGWGGVIWQSPNGNWGREPGLAIEPGATAIRFVAWGESGGEILSFGAGYGMNSTDGFTVELADIMLTDSPTEYEIDVTMIRYETIASGFNWTTESPSVMTFYLNNIRWTP
jgi:hypothetical protein